MACVAMACASNPTPHPAADASYAGADPVVDDNVPDEGNVMPGVTFNDAGLTEADGEATDVLDGDDDVGPEDGGGVTEPMG